MNIKVSLNPNRIPAQPLNAVNYPQGAEVFIFFDEETTPVPLPVTFNLTWKDANNQPKSLVRQEGVRILDLVGTDAAGNGKKLVLADKGAYNLKVTDKNGVLLSEVNFTVGDTQPNPDPDPNPKAQVKLTYEFDPATTEVSVRRKTGDTFGEYTVLK